MTEPARNVIAVEGFDGAGKSTLIEGLRRHYLAAGVETAVIGRGDEAGQYVSGLTTLIKKSDGADDGLSPLSAAYVRLARTHERTRFAAGSTASLVLFDRFVHYDLSQLHPLAHRDVAPLFWAAAEASGLGGVLLLTAPFEILWDRIERRGYAAMSPKERRGPLYNRPGYDRLAATFDEMRLDFPVTSIDATLPVAEVRELAIAAINRLREPAEPIRP